MAVIDLFSKRQKKARRETPDVYVYDQIPQPLRVQIIHILRENLGTYERLGYSGEQTDTGRAYEEIVSILRKEYGVFVLVGTHPNDRGEYLEELSNFLLHEQNTERLIDAIELSCTAIDTYVRNHDVSGRQGNKAADSAISEVNHRLLEHGVGYQFAEGMIVRVDSELIHSEVVKPALKLLHDPKFAGVQNEFLSAHQHYRNGEHKEALVDCLKSIESMLKAICDGRSWQYDSKATCSALVAVCFEHGLIPAFWSQHFNALRATIESGVPTARNRMGGHGQGAAVTEVPDYVAGYVLHQAAAVLVFLGEADKHVT